MKKLLAITLTLVMITTFVLPAAADKYVPSCPNCGYSPMRKTGKKQEYKLSEGTYVEWQFQCFRCGSTLWVGESLLEYG